MRPDHTRAKGVAIARKILTRDQAARLAHLIDNQCEAKAAAATAAALKHQSLPACEVQSMVAHSKLQRFLKTLEERSPPRLFDASHQQLFTDKDDMTLASNLKKLPEIAYLYNDIGGTGPNGTPPIIAIKRGEMGYYPVYENKSPYELNRGANVTYSQASAMLNGAIKGWNLVGADPDHASNLPPKYWNLAIIDSADDSATHHYFDALDQIFPAVDWLRTKGVQYEARKLTALPKGAAVKTFAQFSGTAPAPVGPSPGAMILPGGRHVYGIGGGGTASYPAGEPGP